MKPTTPSLKPLENPEKKETYQMFNLVSKTYDFLNHLFSFGIDILWRKGLHNYLPGSGPETLDLVDLATGTGDVALELASSSKVKRVTAVDLSEGMVAIGRIKAQKSAVGTKIRFQIDDCVTLQSIKDQSADFVTLSFGVRNFYDVPLALQNIYRILKPGGQLVIMEFSLPKNSLMKFFFLFYLRNVIPFVGNLVSRNKMAYTYLNQSIESFPYGQEFCDVIAASGLKKVRAIPLTFGIASLYIGEKLGEKAGEKK